MRYRPVALDATSTLWYLYTTFDVALSYTGDEGRTRYHGGDKKLGFLRGDKNSFGHPEIYAQTPLPLRDLLTKLKNIFSPLYPVRRSKTHISEHDSATALSNRVTPMPTELYAKKRTTVAEKRRLQEEWTARMLAEAAQNAPDRSPATLADEETPPIDYTAVESHDEVLDAFSEAVFVNEAGWAQYDGKAEDQVPRLQKEYMAIQPNAAQASPTDLSSQRTRSSKRERAAEASPAEPSSKRKKTTGGSSSVSRIMADSSANAPTADVALPPEKDDAGTEMRTWDTRYRKRLQEEDLAKAEAAGLKPWDFNDDSDITPLPSDIGEDGDEDEDGGEEEEEEEEKEEYSEGDDENADPTYFD